MSTYMRTISGESTGAVAWSWRLILLLLSWPYAAAMTTRNWLYDYFEPNRIDCPCISVGNITTGGTGKTPLVIWLAQQLTSRGLTAGVISRGYRSTAAGSDELRLIAEHCPEAICIANPDRVAAARLAHERGADIVILDDAFQHRRIARDLDIVVVDSTNPFGHGFVLPRGLLREPLSAFERADVVILSRAPAEPVPAIERLKSELSNLSHDAPVCVCRHRPLGWIGLDQQTFTLDHFQGQTALALSGIGNPAAFMRTLDDLGYTPTAERVYADHHAYSTGQELDELVQHARQFDVVMTTEKDLVKLRQYESSVFGVPVVALQIEIDFVGDTDKMLMAHIDALCKEAVGQI